MILRRRVFVIGAVIAAAGGLSSGCGLFSASAPPVAAPPPCLALKAPVALVVGARSNSPAPALTSAVATVLNSAVDASKTVTLVRLDGQPKIVFSQAPVPGGTALSRDRNRQEYLTTLNRILAGTAQAATDIRAQVPQADVLDALALAASTVPVGGDVIVMDSGLQTTEPLDFRTGLLSDDPQPIVELLRQVGELPDLHGRHVYFTGLGWTASPQPQLSIADRSKVIKIWNQIAKAAGASCVAIDQAVSAKSAIPGLPPVALVSPPPLPTSIVSCSVVRLGDSNHLGFILNSATFSDPAAARMTVRQLADLILRTDESIGLTGSTSSEGSDHYNYLLSLNRANAVKNLLIQFGVPPSHITTKGDGAHLPGRVNDVGPNGQLLIGPAIENRVVIAKLSGTRCGNN